MKRSILGATALCMIGAFAQQAAAQEAGETTDANGVDDIAVQDVVVVTALRREQYLQDVPAAVTNISSKAIENAGITDVVDLQYQVPNISLATGTGTANSARIFLRGVGEDESRGAVDPAVGVYVDGIYMGRQVGSLFDLVDIDRIEVLRGPQGTLYGRNTNGGAIKLVSVKPQFENTGELKTTIGNYGRVDLKGTANWNIADGTALRVTGLKRERDGFWDLVPNGDFANDGKEVGGLDVTAFRATLYHSINDTWDVLLAADRSVDKSDPVPDTAAPGFPSDVDGDIFTIRPSPTTTCSSFVPAPFLPRGCFTDYRNETINQGYSARLLGEFEKFTFTSLTSYRELNDDLNTRIGFPYLQSTDQEQYSQEFTLTSDLDGSFNYVTGVYYFKENVFLDSVFVFPHFVNVQSESKSAFAQGILETSESGTLTAGVRYTDETKDLDAAGPAGGPAVDSQSNAKVSYTLKYDHQLTDDIMVYGSYSTGFKGGGWSPDCFSPAACFLPVEEETLDSFEAGLRSEFFNIVQFNSTVFHNTYKGLQIGATVPGLGFTRFNVDEAEISGLEIEWSIKPTSNFSVFGNLGILDAEYTSLTGDQARGVTNNGASSVCAGVDPTNDAAIINCALGLDLKNAPEYKGVIGAEYLIQGIGGEISLRSDVSFEDESWSLVANDPAFATTDPGTLVNLRAGYTPDSGIWNAAIWMQNATDQEYWRATTASADSIYAAAPMTFGIDLGVSF